MFRRFPVVEASRGLSGFEAWFARALGLMVVTFEGDVWLSFAIDSKVAWLSTSEAKVMLLSSFAFFLIEFLNPKLVDLFDVVNRN